jgi:hypothetical protein
MGLALAVSGRHTADLGRFDAILPSAGEYTAEGYTDLLVGQPVTSGSADNIGTIDYFQELQQLMRDKLSLEFGS